MLDRTRDGKIHIRSRSDLLKVAQEDAQAAAILARNFLADARKDFWTFRKQIHPEMYHGWWQVDLAAHLQIFYEDFIAGKRPKLVIQAPPQHGKSEQVRDFVAWLAGKDPNLRTIFASYSDELGMTSNLNLQRIFMTPQYKAIWHGTRIRGTNERTGEGARRNTGIIEFMGAKGSFRNTTVKGQITGFGLDLGIIDDPMKGRAEAQSKTTRDRTWEWLVDDFFSRFSKDAGMIMIMTRWHVDDPIGRWLEYFPKTKVLKYSAIADSADDWTVKAGYRKVGEELFPQWKPYDFLMERKQLMAIAGWESEYQQNPIVAGGDVFPIERLEVIQSVERSKIMSSIRYFDKAGTEGAGASTAGVLMHRMADGSFVVEDVIRGQWGALERERRIKQAANADQALCPGNYEIWVEQEPGSGGKESAESTVRNLAGFNAYADRVSGKGSKEIRAEPFAAQVQNGNVKVKSFDGIAEYFNELEAFPGSKNKDQVDASSGAFNKLIAGTEYDITGSWIGDLESLIPRRSVY